VHLLHFVAAIDTNVGDACSEDVAVVIIDLNAVDGTTCATQTLDATANETCASEVQNFMYEWTTADIEGLTGAPAALACYADVSGMEAVTVYPAQFMAVVNTNVGDACSEDAGAVIIDLVSADGVAVCASMTLDAPINETCAVVTESIAYMWSAADIEGITTAPAALACYTDVSGMEMVNVYPAQPSVNMMTVGDACTGDTDVVTLEIVDAAGTVCDTRTYDALPNTSCGVDNQEITDTYTGTDIETLFGIPATLAGSCYTDLSISENVNVYPDPSTWIVIETEGNCNAVANLMITTASGDLCINVNGPLVPGFICPDTDGEAPLNYNIDLGFPAACNMIFTGTIDAICPVGCCANAGSLNCCDTPLLKEDEEDNKSNK